MGSIDIPSGSIYMWMYVQGLKHVPFDELIYCLGFNGKEVRKKDIDNYWNGFNNSNIYRSDVFNLTNCRVSNGKKRYDTKYHDYPYHPLPSISDPLNRFVPCNEDNKPMIKWSRGCMEMDDAMALMHQRYLGENLKGCHKIVIDCDGDHGDELDTKTMLFLSKYIDETECWFKRRWYNINGNIIPMSYHLTFLVDRVIPTMHFPKAHIDIIGNKENSLRYFKDKGFNELIPIDMTDEIWDDIMGYIKTREEE